MKTELSTWDEDLMKMEIRLTNYFRQLSQSYRTGNITKQQYLEKREFLKFIENFKYSAQLEISYWKRDNQALEAYAHSLSSEINSLEKSVNHP